MKKLKDIIFIAILSLMFVMMLIGLVGCRSVKKSQTTEADFTDSTNVEKQSLVEVSKEVNLVAEKSDIVFNPLRVLQDTIFPDCPPNEVIYRNNGDVEVRGSIKHFNYEKSSLQSKVDSLSEQLEKEKRNIKVHTVTETVVKRKAQWWCLWLIIPAFLFGVYVGVKYHNKIKTL